MGTEKYIQLEVDGLHRQLVLHWQGFVPSDIYREAFLEAVQVSRKGNLQTWVMDMKHMKVIRQVDQEWTVNVWFPQFHLLGIKRLAFVVSDDIFNQMAVSSMVAALRPKFNTEVEYFQEFASAIRWVQETSGGILRF